MQSRRDRVVGKTGRKPEVSQRARERKEGISLRFLEVSVEYHFRLMSHH